MKTLRKMKTDKEIDVVALLDKPISLMYGREWVALNRYANKAKVEKITGKEELCTGISALAERLGCCESTVFTLKREGVLKDAIISHIGKKIVFDVDKAREAAEEFTKHKRTK